MSELWKKADHDHGLDPVEKLDLACSICGTEMVRHHSVLHKGYNADDYVCGQMYKCPECSNYHQFEVPVSEEYYRELEDRRDGEGAVFTDWKNIDHDQIRRRMKELGYW